MVVKTKCYSHQLKALEYGLAKNKFLLADEQGLGKTKESIDISVNRKLRGEVNKCLIVCGVNSTKYNWGEEILIHSDEEYFLVDGSKKVKLEILNNWKLSNKLFCIINVESLRIEEVVLCLLDSNIDMIILDEAHKCKNAESLQGKVINMLNATYKIALTGTPIHNKPMDIYNILKWLEVENRNFYQFRNRYCILNNFKNIVGNKNMMELNTIIFKIMLRRTKKEVLDLPPKIYKNEYVQMSPKQIKLYKGDKKSIIQKLKDGISVDTNPLVELLNLRKIVSGIFTIENPKLDRLLELIEDIKEENKKVIVFFNYKEVAKKVLEALLEGKIKDKDVYYIDGDVKVINRQMQVNEFQNSKGFKIIMGTIGAMGTGITLNKAEYVIFYDKNYNPSENKQAEDRSHRIGTVNSVNIISLLCRDSIDIKIEKMLKEKSEVIEELLRDKNRLLKYVMEE